MQENVQQKNVTEFISLPLTSLSSILYIYKYIKSAKTADIGFVAAITLYSYLTVLSLVTGYLDLTAIQLHQPNNPNQKRECIIIIIRKKIFVPNRGKICSKKFVEDETYTQCLKKIFIHTDLLRP